VSAISGFCEKCSKFRKRYCDGDRNTCMSILFDTIEALQKENNGWRERYDELDAGHSRLFKDFCKLQQENEQLQAQLDEWKYEAKCHMDEVIAREKQIEQLQARVARVRDALIIANNYMPDIGHFCTCGKCKRCGTDIGYSGYEYCLKCARVIIDAALSDTPADYHNPADVEALIMAMEAIKAAWSDGSANAAMDKASEALAAIDKAIGG